MQNPDKSYDYIYCHNDGNIRHNGRILLDYYKTTEHIQKLIKLGDLSSLGTNMEPTTDNHTFDHPEPNVCVFYQRDRGETDCGPYHTDTITYFEDYNYLWKDEQWYVYYKQNWIPLSKQINKETTKTCHK